ncbi:hypothetical protein IGI57_000299 [Enterococcus sp. DIV0213j]
MKNKAAKVEADLLELLEKKKSKQITLSEIKQSRSYENFLCFTGCMRDFQTIKRTYVRSYSGVLTVFKL